jgi:hypothetical protein
MFVPTLGTFLHTSSQREPKGQDDMSRNFVFTVVIFAVISSGTFAQSPSNNPATAPSQGSSNADSNKSGTTMASNGVIKVLSPKVDESLGSSAVTVKFQLENTGAAADSTPTYRVQLDGRDPVEITSTEHSFSGLADGDHVLSIELVDANHTAVPQSRTEVRFRTYTPGTSSKATTSSSTVARPAIRAKWELPSGEGKTELPTAATELPLLSMVGFGVLVGGVISAMRTRR